MAVAIKHWQLAFPIGNKKNTNVLSSLYSLYNVINKVEQECALSRFTVGYKDTHKVIEWL